MAVNGTTEEDISAKKEAPATDTEWIRPQQERVVALGGLAAALVLAGSLATTSVDVAVMEKMALGLCLFGGFAAWLFPPHPRHLLLSRLLGWATLCGILFLLSPMHIPKWSTEQALRSSSPAVRRDATRVAVRLGLRDLSGTNLSGADLREVDLGYTVLRNVDFTDADLSRAFLSEADLSGATLMGTRLEGADLRGAKLEAANVGTNPKTRPRCDRFTQPPRDWECEHGLLAPRTTARQTLVAPP